MRIVDNPETIGRNSQDNDVHLEGPPRLIVVVDTEESFDWAAPFDRKATDTAAMSEIGRGQEICEAFGIAPTYVIDYPVSCDAQAAHELAGLAREGRAGIGAHLHSWVSPPYEEPVDDEHSYQGNLSRELEFCKLERLTQNIEENVGVRPQVHKAGRYGFGWNTALNLDELGYRIDLSPTPGFNLTADGGPDFRNAPNAPFWLDNAPRILCLPCTGQIVGSLPSIGRMCDPWVRGSMGQRLRLGGIASRLGLFERIRLSPEGFELADMKRLTLALLAGGERYFCISYHSPTLKPGCTPYVRNDAELSDFLDRLRGYLEFFIHEVGGIPATPLGLLDEIEACSNTNGLS